MADRGAVAAILPQQNKDAVTEELADILLYLVRLSDKLEVDLLEAALLKLEKNAVKYPAEQVRGSCEEVFGVLITHFDFD